MGSKTGIMKIAAKRAGLTLEAYQRRLDGGEKWCTRCKDWHQRSDFGKDQSRGDGLTAQCAIGRNSSSRQSYVPRPRPKPGRRFVAVRCGDKKQAVHRVNYLVHIGILPNPNAIACTDCGHTGADKRHEYDHYKGYDAENHENVQPVCTACHHRRERERVKMNKLTTVRELDGRTWEEMPA
jgi:hypothetical protein